MIWCECSCGQAVLLGLPQPPFMASPLETLERFPLHMPIKTGVLYGRLVAPPHADVDCDR